MAYENSIGQALALGTLAHPDNSHPFTNAVIHNQKLDLAEASRKAKEDAAAKKLSEDMLKRIDIEEGTVAPIYLKDYHNLASEGFAKLQLAKQKGDISAAQQIRHDYQSKMDAIAENSKNAIDAAKNPNSWAATNFADAIYDVDGKNKIRKSLQDNPDSASIVQFDKNDIPIFANTQHIDRNVYAKSKITKDDATEDVYEPNPKTGKLEQKISENQYHRIEQYKKPTDQKIEQEVANALQNKAYMTEVLHSDGYKEELGKIKKSKPEGYELTPTDMAQALHNESKKDFNIHFAYDYMKQQPRQGKPDAKQVNFQTTNIPRNQSGDYGTILDASDGNITRTSLTTPKEGESKPLELPSNGFFFIGKDGTKQYIKSPTVKGIPTAVMTAENSKGGKQGVIEVTGISLSPSEYLKKSYGKRPDVKIIDDGTKTYAYTGDIQNPNIIEAYPSLKNIQVKGYIPLTKENSNKIHSEYSMYGKTDFNGTISKVHGVIIGSGGYTPKSDVKTSVTKQGTPKPPKKK